MTKLIPENLTFSVVGHLPIVKDFAKKGKLIEPWTPWSIAKWKFHRG
jgi:hypothetical protein